MSDLISRRMMLDKMIRHKSLFSTNQYEYIALSKVDKARADEIDNCIADLRNAPDAEPERTAKVTLLTPESKGYWSTKGRCQNCGFLLERKHAYCQNCGVRLDWNYEHGVKKHEKAKQENGNG